VIARMIRMARSDCMSPAKARGQAFD